MDALAALTAFIPEKGLQLARYYGYYSNKARGKRRRQNATTAIPGATSCPDAGQNDDFRRFCRRAWARLIRKVYPMHLLFRLYGGMAAGPCGSEAEAVLLDWNGDCRLDLTDALGALRHLFAGGPAPALATGCVRVPGCEDACVR